MGRVVAPQSPKGGRIQTGLSGSTGSIQLTLHLPQKTRGGQESSIPTVTCSDRERRLLKPREKHHKCGL